MPKSVKTDKSFEDAFNKLETIVQTMEKGDTPLEEALKLFEEGMSLVKYCNGKLNEAETKLQRLVKNEDGTFQLDLIE